MRVTLSARHKMADVEQLLNALAHAVAAVLAKDKTTDLNMFVENRGEAWA